MSTCKRIAITPGEPAGIGPDICLEIAQQEFSHELVFIADIELLQERNRLLGTNIDIHHVDVNRPPIPHRANSLNVHHIPLVEKNILGQLNKNNASYVLACLDQAVEGCLISHYDALVTGPLHKGVINDAGIPFQGHTEYLAEKTKSELPVMMLAGGNLRVALVTTHLPLSKISEAITAERLEKTLRIIDHDLQKRFQLAKPKIGICGLNPHAGEGGHLGREEIETISPVIEKLKLEGLDLVGPLPADTIFTPGYMMQFDVIVAMYHDQGLPVLKHHAFGDAVNITLGLSIIRTSVDHGTALDLAGSGKTDSGSLDAALKLAADLI